MKSLVLFILFILVSCGKPTKDCISGAQKVYMCQAEVTGNFYPNHAPQTELDRCKTLYVPNACY